MRAWALVIVPSIGCAQLLGLDETTGRDGGTDGASGVKRDSMIDGKICSAGDARIVDESTGACYSFFSAMKTRDEARATCADVGATLATIQTGAENQLIAGIIGQSLVFVGGNDETTEGTFKWDDGSSVVLTNWNTGEPNNGGGNFEEDCIVIHGDLGGKWDDRPCSAITNTIPGAYPFVCERD
jgi:hypothetical protein